MKYAHEVFGALQNGVGFSGGQGMVETLVDGETVHIEIGQFIRPSGKMSKEDIEAAKEHIEDCIVNRKKWKEYSVRFPNLKTALSFSWPMYYSGGGGAPFPEEGKIDQEFVQRWNLTAPEVEVLRAYGDWSQRNYIEASCGAGVRAAIVRKKVELAEKFLREE